jgi:micrococcal nuclease
MLGKGQAFPRKGPLAVVVLLVGALVAGWHFAEQTGWLAVWFPWTTPPLIADDGSGELLHVRDGDTVEIRYHDLSLPVRLKCVDTAESVHPDKERNNALGKMTSQWAKQYLSGKRIRVEFAREKWHIAQDRYDRALGWLWLDHGTPGPSDDDELFNETLVRQGYSAYVTSFGNASIYHARMLAAEQLAKQKKLGVWRR